MSANSTTPNATERETSITPPNLANTGEKVVKMTKRASAISDPIASATALNHLTIQLSRNTRHLDTTSLKS